MLKQFESLLETVSLNELEIKDQIKNEVQRFKRFNRVVLGNKDKAEIGAIDIRNYAKYVLTGTNDTEKRELLGCLKSRIILKEKTIYLGEK